jgi:hypothetical protein
LPLWGAWRQKWMKCRTNVRGTCWENQDNCERESGLTMWAGAWLASTRSWVQTLVTAKEKYTFFLKYQFIDWHFNLFEFYFIQL